MLDDNKHETRVPVNLTDREFHDANVQAMALDKRTSEYIRFVVRQVMYGSLSMGNEKEYKSSRDE